MIRDATFLDGGQSHVEIRTRIIVVSIGEVSQIVQIAECHKRLYFRTRHTESVQLVAVVSATSGREAPEIPCLIFLFQLHIHHEGTIVHISASGYGGEPPLVVDLDAVNSKGGQVIKQNVGLVTEERRSVNEQTLHITAVDKDASAILELYPRQLLNQGFERTALSQIESIGIIDQRVTTDDELHLCSFDHHLT